jgi:hypothetical protein
MMVWLVIVKSHVIADLIRNPVAAWHWIPDVETPDLIRGRDDSFVMAWQAVAEKIND